VFLIKSQQNQIQIRHRHFLFHKAYDKDYKVNAIVSICQVQGALKFITPWILYLLYYYREIVTPPPPDGKGFPLLQANPQTDKRCAADQTADSLSNGWNAKSIFKGCLSGLIFFNHTSEYIYEALAMMKI